MRRLLQAWVLGCLLLGGAALGKEAYTVGYAVDEGSFERLARGDWANVDRDLEEIFGPPKKIEFTVAVPAKAPIKSRFFGKGDELLTVTGQMREAGVLTLDASWAVYNRTQRRLVLLGHAIEHSRFVMCWQGVNGSLPKLISVKSQLLQARCTEFGAVEWTEQEVTRRGGEVLASCGTVGRPGSKVETTIEDPVTGWRLRAEVEHNIGADLRVVDVRFDFGASQKGGDRRVLQLKSGISTYVEHPVYIELGETGEEGMVYLLEMRAAVLFMDGTPVSQAWTYEDGSESGFDYHGPKPFRKLTDEGLVVASYAVPPTFVEDLTGSPISDESDDPFAAPVLDAEKDDLRNPAPAIEAPEGSPYFGVGDLLFDIGPILKDKGVGIAAEGWAIYSARNSTVVVKTDPENADLVDVLLDGG